MWPINAAAMFACPAVLGYVAQAAANKSLSPVGWQRLARETSVPESIEGVRQIAQGAQQATGHRVATLQPFHQG